MMAKRQLPFRVEIRQVRGYPQVILHFQRHLPGGGHDEGALQVGPPLDQNDAPYFRDPCGVAILELIGMYGELLQENEALVKQRDELIAAEADRLEPTRKH